MTVKVQAALQLARLTTSPAVLASLVPLAAPEFDSSARFAVSLDPADARRLASRGDARIGDVVAFLTDDPDALTLLARLDLRHYSRNRVFEHPNLPIEVCFEMGVAPPGGLSEEVVPNRVAAAVPTVELVELAFSLESRVAAHALLRHRDLAAPEAFRALELAANGARSLVPTFGGFLLSSPSLPRVLGRSEPGGVPDLATLLDSVDRLLSSSPSGVAWFESDASLEAKLVRYLLESADLGLGEEVGAPFVELFDGRPEHWNLLVARDDLSLEACGSLSALVWAGARTEAAARGLTLERFSHPDGLPFEDRQASAKLVSTLSKLAASPSCPLEVARSIPCNVRDLAPLARILPDDPEVWEVAVHLLADAPAVSFGELADAAASLAS